MGLPLRFFDTGLPRFERALQSGALIREGARLEGHQAKLREVWRQQGSGTREPYAGEAFRVGDTIKRTWDCKRPGFLKVLHMDHFVHEETFAKPTQDSLNVEDRFTWHDGKSHAERSYRVEARSPAALSVTTGRWDRHMGGLPFWAPRGKVERAMGQELPKIDDKLYGLLNGLARAEARLVSHPIDCQSDNVTLRS